MGMTENQKAMLEQAEERALRFEKHSKVQGDCVWIGPGVGPETREAFPHGMVVYVPLSRLGNVSTSWLMVP
jgi:hypothetical protein